MTRVAIAVLVLAAALVGCGDDDSGDGDGLPEVGEGIPEAYRIVYEVVTPDARGTEERTVHRPFDARVVQRDAAGAVTAERWSTLGVLVTRSQGADAVRIDTAVAPAASDVRPERFTDRLVEAGRLEERTGGRVRGRACVRVAEASDVLTAVDPGAEGEAGEPISVPVTVERCVDDQGLVLEERWTTRAGERVLTKRAVELELGDNVPTIEVPDATPLPAEQGNGAVREIDADERPPFVEAWERPVPDGFTFVGRYAVSPARLSTSSSAVPGEADLALYTDVWRRGPDVIMLDQGAADGGATPFDPETALGPVELAGIGPAELAVDVRIAEVRLTRPVGGFVRVAGTIDPDDLVALAGNLRPLGATP